MTLWITYSEAIGDGPLGSRQQMRDVSNRAWLLNEGTKYGQINSSLVNREVQHAKKDNCAAAENGPMPSLRR